MFNNDIRIYGKHAAIMKRYSKSSSNANSDYKVNDIDNDLKDFYIFSNYYNCFTTAAILGIIENRKSESSNDKSVDATIFASKLVAKKDDLTNLYQSMIFTDDDGLDADKKIKKAFRVLDSDEKIKEAKGLFLSYVFGGLEIIDEKFNDCNTTEDVVNCISDLLIDYPIEMRDIPQ